MKELTLPVICRNALTIVALVNDFVYPSFLGVIEHAKAHFCPDVLNSDYLKVPLLLSVPLSKNGLLSIRHGSNERDRSSPPERSSLSC